VLRYVAMPRIIPVFCAISFALMLFLSGSARGQSFTLTVDAAAVSFDVSVTDDKGRPIAGLGRDDFQVLENGVTREIHYFGPSVEPYPYHLYILVDSSGSTANKWEFMQRVAASFLAYARPVDRVSVGAFGAHLKTLSDWGAGQAQQFATLRFDKLRLASGRTTQFYRGMDQALGQLFDDVPERRALVVLTDGRDSSLYYETLRRNRVAGPINDMWFNRLFLTASDTGVPIYFIGLNTDRNFEYNQSGTDEYRELEKLYKGSSIADEYLSTVRFRMEELSDVSGGRAVFPRTTDDVIPLIEEIGRSLGAAYSIGFVPEPAEPGEGARTIEVAVKGWNNYIVQQYQTEYQPK